jgi:hypothetical protein
MMTNTGLPSIKKLSTLENLEFFWVTIILPKSKLHPTYISHHFGSMSLESTSSAPSPYSMAPRSFQSAPSPFKPTSSSNSFERNTAQHLYLHLNLSMG